MQSQHKSQAVTRLPVNALPRSQYQQGDIHARY
jgi:hypothetical protein